MNPEDEKTTWANEELRQAHGRSYNSKYGKSADQNNMTTFILRKLINSNIYSVFHKKNEKHILAHRSGLWHAEYTTSRIQCVSKN